MIKVSRKINRTCTEGNNIQFFMIQAIKKQIFFFHFLRDHDRDNVIHITDAS